MQMARRLFDDLYRISSDTPGVTRDSFGDGEAAAYQLMVNEAERLGLSHRVDPIGNLYVTLPGKDQSPPVLMTGLHLDGVPHGGNFDGAAGVIAGQGIPSAMIFVRNQNGSHNPDEAMDFADFTQAFEIYADWARRFAGVQAQ